MGYRVIRSDAITQRFKECGVGDYFYVHDGRSEQMWQCIGMEDGAQRWSDRLDSTMFQSILDNADKPPPVAPPQGYGDF